jgi:acetyl esterase/lipase
LIYFHGGGYTVGSVDEFENALRLVAEQSGCQVYTISTPSA